MIFRDRHEAGIKLAAALSKYRQREDLLIIALPGGGIPVAREVAIALKAPLEVFITRKISVPGDPELAAGAVSENGDIYLDRDKVEDFAIHDLYLAQEIARRQKEIAHLQWVCRSGMSRREIKGYIAIVVDDGIACGATIFATLKALKKEGPKKLILAVPVVPLDLLDTLKGEADEVIALAKPFPLSAVGAFYERFDPVSDTEVALYLRPPLVGAERR